MLQSAVSLGTPENSSIQKLSIIITIEGSKDYLFASVIKMYTGIYLGDAYTQGRTLWLRTRRKMQLQLPIVSVHFCYFSHYFF